jgi:membrane-associated phospholipid phosphatase
MAAFLVNALIAVPLFVLWPAAYPRPVVDPALGLSETAVALLQFNDPATNTFPSLHVANSVLCATALRRAGSAVWRGSAVLAACVAVSVLLVKQHWLADVVGGVLCAAASTFVLGRAHAWLERRPRAS